MKKLIFTFLFCLTLIGSANAATYCVATTGSDSADGIDDGSPACWLTIQKALNTVAVGDTVNVRAGTYRQRLTVTTSGTAGNQIVFQGAAGAIIDGGDVITGWTAAGSGVYTKSVASIGYTPNNATWNDTHIGYIGPGSISNSEAINKLSLDGSSTYWDGRIAQAGVISGTGNVAIRHRSNADPNVSNVTLAPFNVGALTFTSKSYVTFKGFTIKNSYSCVKIDGGGNNVIEGNSIRQCSNMIELTGSTNANLIQSNDITQNYIFTDFGHPRERSLSDYNALWATRVDGDLYGQGVWMNGAGTGNIIKQNHIYRAMSGIWIAGGSPSDNYNANTLIAENIIENCADFCLLPHQGTMANLEVRDNTFHEFHEGIRFGPIRKGPVYIYRNKFTMDTYPTTISNGGGASVWFASIFCDQEGPFPSQGIYLYHNSLSGSGYTTYWNDCGVNSYWINNIFSSEAFFIGPFYNSNPTYFNYNWIGGAGAFNPPPGNANNLIQNNIRIWAEGPSTLVLPSNSNARNMGQNLSTTWDSGAGGSKAALPGMSPGYFSGSQPDAGAIQFTGAPGGTPGFVQLSASTYSVSESGTNATITLTRTSGTLGAASVQLATSNGTATAGSDYTAVTQTVSWTDGDAANKTVSIPITSDASVEGNETVTITLSGAGGATLGSPNTATLTIVDDDVAPSAGTLQFSAATYTVAENGTSVTITVTRTGGSVGAVGVSYATSNGTATAGSDYTSASGTLSWANAETTSKTFAVTIANEGTNYEGNETVNLTLSSPTGGATLGAPTTAVLTITDDDPAPVGLLTHWPFEEASGSGNGATSLDTSGNGRTVTLFGSGGANLGSGRLNLAGAENDYATAPVGTTWIGDYTVVVDVQANSTGQAAGATVFNNYANWFSADTSDSFQIDVNGASPGVYRYNSVTGQVFTIATVTTSRQILAVTKSGTTLKLYNNGTLIDTQTVASGAGNTFRHYVFGVNRPGTVYFAGKIYDAQVYSGALSDAAIAAFSSAGTPTPPSGVTVTRSTTTDSLDVAWTDNSTDETSFKLHQNVAGGGYALLATLNPNEVAYVAPIVTAGASHCFKVLATNSSGDSSFATEACLTAPPMSAAAVTASPGNLQAALAWQNIGADVGGILILMRSGAAVADRPTDTSTYNVSDTIGTSTVIFNGAASTPNFTKTSLTNGTTYHFKIFTKSIASNRYSAGVAVSTTPIAPAIADRTLRPSLSLSTPRGVRQ